jgi:quercetin dioxygenase-like cupin family protein
MITARSWRALGRAAIGPIVVAAGLTIPFASEAQAPAAPPAGAQSPTGISSSPLFANDRVSAIKLSFAPGARESVHTHPFDIMVIQLTPGEVDLSLEGKESSGHIDAGRVTYIPAQALHWAGNAGKAPFDMVVVALR